MKLHEEEEAQWRSEDSEEPGEKRARSLDGIVVGLGGLDSRSERRPWVKDTWVLNAPPDESIAEFFIEDADPDGAHSDPTAWVCRKVGSGGTIVLGMVNLSSDCFLSEIFAGGEED